MMKLRAHLINLWKWQKSFRYKTTITLCSTTKLFVQKYRFGTDQKFFKKYNNNDSLRQVIAKINYLSSILLVETLGMESISTMATNSDIKTAHPFMQGEVRAQIHKILDLFMVDAPPTPGGSGEDAKLNAPHYAPVLLAWAVAGALHEYIHDKGKLISSWDAYLLL